MTKQQLLDALTTKFYKVTPLTLVKDELGIKEYRLYPYVKVGDIVYNQYVSFYVEDEGLPTESAYWGGSEPQRTIVPSFTSKVQTFIDGKIQQGTQIKYAWIVSSNEGQKKAFVTGYTPANAVKNGFITDDGSGNLLIELF